MPTLARCARGALFAAFFTIPLGCREPTEAIVEITTDAPCEHVFATGIRAGLFEDIETKDYDTTTSSCEKSGDVGSIVLLPPEDDNEAKFAFRVVTSLGTTPVESCVPPAYGPDCIVARRAMRFVEHVPFTVPVRMSQACAGVSCPANQSCVDGVCRTITLDPGDCSKPGGCDPKPGVVPAWQKDFSAPGQQIARSLALADDGTLAVTGFFDGDTFDMGGGALGFGGVKDIYLATYSQAGIFRWAKSFGGAGDDEGVGVAIDGQGSIYLLALFDQKIDFGGGELTSKGGWDVALVKFTSFGALQWSLSFGSPANDVPSGVAVDADGNVYVTGQFSETISIGATKLTPAGGADAFLASFTPSGDLRWAKTFGGPGDDGTNGVAVDGAGDVYIAGYFEQQVDYGGKAPLESVGAADVLVASYTPAGAVRWAKGFGSGARDLAYGIAARDERIVVVGEIANDVTLDGITLSAASDDGFVVSLKPSGELAWGKAFGGSGFERGESVAVAKDGSIVLGGSTYDSSVFGSEPPVGSPMSVANPFVAVLEGDGSTRWARLFQSSFFGYLTGVGAPPDGYAFVAGWFQGELDLGEKKLSATGAEDTLLLRLAPP